VEGLVDTRATLVDSTSVGWQLHPSGPDFPG
jgi:hypothetical protein